MNKQLIKILNLKSQKVADLLESLLKEWMAKPLLEWILINIPVKRKKPEKQWKICCSGAYRPHTVQHAETHLSLSKICLKRNVYVTFAIESFCLKGESALSAVWQRDDVQDRPQSLEFNSFPVVQLSWKLSGRDETWAAQSFASFFF